MSVSKKARTKALTKNKTQENRTIDTTLVNKDEVFRMLALAEATGLPLLLEGPPGVAKTKSVIDYAKAWMLKGVDQSDRNAVIKANVEFLRMVYILETDEGTKSSEVKGRPNMYKLFVENKYELSTPLADAVVAIINEVDKAGPNIRNSLLGVMNERFLFNGEYKIPCKWKLFVATCNEIPRDEIGNPFWDRFVLKLKVNRVTQGELVKYYKKGGREFRGQFTIGIPSKQEMDAVIIPPGKLEKFIKVAYQHCSDRTLTYVPTLTKAISFIWDVSVNEALIKACALMINNNVASELKDQLLSPTMKQLIAKVDMLWTTKTNEELQNKLTEIGNLVQNHASTGTLNQEEMEEINSAVNHILDNHKLEEDSLLEEEVEVEEFPA